MGALRQHYPWLSGGLDYFVARLDQAPADAQFAFQFVANHACTYAEQKKAINALREKCEILWAQLDALLLFLRAARMASPWRLSS